MDCPAFAPSFNVAHLLVTRNQSFEDFILILLVSHNFAGFIDPKLIAKLFKKQTAGIAQSSRTFRSLAPFWSAIQFTLSANSIRLLFATSFFWDSDVTVAFGLQRFATDHITVQLSYRAIW